METGETVSLEQVTFVGEAEVEHGIGDVCHDVHTLRRELPRADE